MQATMKGDEQEEAREHKDAANPIRKNIFNRKGNDEVGQQLESNYSIKLKM